MCISCSPIVSVLTVMISIASEEETFSTKSWILERVSELDSDYHYFVKLLQNKSQWETLFCH